MRHGVTWLGPAPGCRVSPEVTGLSPGPRDCSRGFSPKSSSGRVEAEGSRAPRFWSGRHFRGVGIEGRVCAGKGLHQGDYFSPLVVFLFLPSPKLIYTRITHTPLGHSFIRHTPECPLGPAHGSKPENRHAGLSCSPWTLGCCPPYPQGLELVGRCSNQC